MATIFNEGDEVTKDWLNGVSKTVTDGLGDKYSPAEIRVHINAEQAGAASAVQTNLDNFKNTKGIANGLCPLGSNAKVPTAYLPPTGGYAGVYETQALMVADGASHLSGEVFLVTDDPTPALNGEYTATINAPTVIGDYYFNSGEVAPHTHPGTDVSLEVTATQDIAVLQSWVDASDTRIDDLETDAEKHIEDAPIDSNEYLRKDGAWVKPTVSGGDLKSDGSIAMAGSYIAAPLGQSLVTRTMMEENFTDRLDGYATGGIERTTDLDAITKTSTYWGASDADNLPSDFGGFFGVVHTYVDATAGYRKQTVTRVNDVATFPGGTWARRYSSSVWSDWSLTTTGLNGYTADGTLEVYVQNIGLIRANSDYYVTTASTEGTFPAGFNKDASGVLSTRMISASAGVQTLTSGYQPGNAGKTWTRTIGSPNGPWTGGLALWKGTQAEYDLLTPDDDTIYHIVG